MLMVVAMFDETNIDKDDRCSFDELEQLYVRLGAGPRTAWTILQHDGPNHLGVRCDALPPLQMALITSGRVSG